MLKDLSIEELKELNKEFAKELCFSKLSVKQRITLEECMFIVKDLMNKKKDGIKDAEGVLYKV